MSSALSLLLGQLQVSQQAEADNRRAQLGVQETQEKGRLSQIRGLAQAKEKLDAEKQARKEKVDAKSEQASQEQAAAVAPEAVPIDLPGGTQSSVGGQAQSAINTVRADGGRLLPSGGEGGPGGVPAGGGAGPTNRLQPVQMMRTGNTPSSFIQAKLMDAIFGAPPAQQPTQQQQAAFRGQQLQNRGQVLGNQKARADAARQQLTDARVTKDRATKTFDAVLKQTGDFATAQKAGAATGRGDVAGYIDAFRDAPNPIKDRKAADLAQVEASTDLTRKKITGEGLSNDIKRAQLAEVSRTPLAGQMGMPASREPLTSDQRLKQTEALFTAPSRTTTGGGLDPQTAANRMVLQGDYINNNQLLVLREGGGGLLAKLTGGGENDSFVFEGVDRLLLALGSFGDKKFIDPETGKLREGSNAELHEIATFINTSGIFEVPTAGPKGGTVVITGKHDPVDNHNYRQAIALRDYAKKVVPALREALLKQRDAQRGQ